MGGASLVVPVSLFLPWFGFSALGASIGVSGTTAHGYLVLAVIALPAALPAVRSRQGRG